MLKVLGLSDPRSKRTKVLEYQGLWEAVQPWFEEIKDWEILGIGTLVCLFKGSLDLILM